MSNTTDYTNTESVPASVLQVGDVVLKPRHPDRPYRITRVDVLQPTGRIKVRAISVFAAYGLGPGTFGRFAPGDTVQRAVTE